MQLNGKVVKGVRNARSLWFTVLAVIFGVAFIGLGIYFYITDQAKTFESATATITSIESEMMGGEEEKFVIKHFGLLAQKLK